MGFGGFLKTQQRFATVLAVRMAAGEESGLGDPYAVFILTELHFRERNNHDGHKLTCSLPDVKEDG